MWNLIVTPRLRRSVQQSYRNKYLRVRPCIRPFCKRLLSQYTNMENLILTEGGPFPFTEIRGPTSEYICRLELNSEARPGTTEGYASIYVAS